LAKPFSGVARPKSILRTLRQGVKGAAVGPLAGPGQSPGRGPRKLIDFHHLEMLKLCIFMPIEVHKITN
jgi:hypothetical protein